jgi:inner membrane protein
MLTCAVLAMLPDADALPIFCGIFDDHGPVGHRGLTHTPLFALLIGVLVFLAGRWRRWSEPLRCGVIAALLVGSHCLLDAMAQQGRGIMLGWPFSEARFHFPWRPIPDAPFGRALFSQLGISHLSLEFAYFLPLTLYSLWPNRATFIALGRRLRAATTAMALLMESH